MNTRDEQQPTGYVKRKIRAQKTSKEKPLVTRARASRARISTKKEETLHDLLAPYLPAAVQARVDGLKATKVAWNQATHSFEDTGLPDNKVRADCARGRSRATTRSSLRFSRSSNNHPKHGGFYLQRFGESCLNNLM
jgi:hypothetical protein